MEILIFFWKIYGLWLISGVSYLSRRQEEEALRHLNSRYEDDSNNWSEVKEVPLARISDVLFSERMKNRLSEWRDGLLNKGNGTEESQFQTVFYKMRPALCLSGFTSHQLKLIQLVICSFILTLFYLRKVWCIMG